MVRLVVRRAVADPGEGSVDVMGGHHMVVFERRAYSYIFSRSSKGRRWRVLGSGCSESVCSISLIAVSSSDEVMAEGDRHDVLESDECEAGMRKDLRWR